MKVLVLLFRRVLESYPVSTHYKCMIFQVSWLRRRGGEDVPVLLTFGESVYVSDVRFSIRRGSHEDWILDLLHVKSTDEALYECQVSTEPPQIHKIFLAVEGKHDCFFSVCLSNQTFYGKFPESITAVDIHFTSRQIMLFLAPILTVMDGFGRELLDQFYKVGSSLEVMCQVDRLPARPLPDIIEWRHGNAKLPKANSTSGQRYTFLLSV